MHPDINVHDKRRPESATAGHRLLTLCPERLHMPFPKFCVPTVLGHFSLDSRRQMHFDRRQIKYVCWPSDGVGTVAGGVISRPRQKIQPGDSASVNWRLSDGLDVARRKQDELLDERLDNMLRWIARNRRSLRHSQHRDRLAADFVCYRGLLTKLMNTPYETRDEWIICATMWRGTIYLCKFDSARQLRQLRCRSQHQRDMCSWGYKFEQFLLSDESCSSPVVSLPVDENEELCCVLRSRVCSHSVLYGAEVDGVDTGRCDLTADVPPMAAFVELKTSRHVETHRQQTALHRKMLRWWAQSFLVGIDTIVVGWRDDSGLVSELSTYATNQLPKMQTHWRANVCMDFLERFLSFVRAYPALTDNAYAGVKFEFCPSEGAVTGTPFDFSRNNEDSQRFRVLPEWFLTSSDELN